MSESQVISVTGRLVTFACALCGAPRSVYRAHFERVAEATCSRICNGKLRHRELLPHAHKGRAGWTDSSLNSFRWKMSGDKNPAWRGGVTVFNKHGSYAGVRYVRCPEDMRAMARADGYVMEHRLVVARLAGRVLSRTEVVHHVDHDPRNNAPENLELWPSNRLHKLAEHGRPVDGACNDI